MPPKDKTKAKPTKAKAKPKAKTAPKVATAPKTPKVAPKPGAFVTDRVAPPRRFYDPLDSIVSFSLADDFRITKPSPSFAERRDRRRTDLKAFESMVKALASDTALNEGIRAMRARVNEFTSPMTADLAGIAVVPEARAMLDRRLDEMWERESADPTTMTQEVVIGGGLHAAIYSAVRVAKGYDPPLVIEGSPRVGGAFAVSRESAFYLNSRNRPGPLGLPGMRMGALNVLPGAPIQPADLSGDEYQRNTDLAYAIRCTLAMKARVMVGCKVVDIAPYEGSARRYGVWLDDGTKIGANRIVIATGLGTPRPLRRLGDGRAYETDGKRVMTFPEFMAAMDMPFPLRGMRNVAVVGAGDSGRTVVEALIGQGPTSRWSVATLDYVENIDWYGGDGDKLQTSRAEFEKCNRSRYRGIGRAMPVDGRPGRITPLLEQATSIAPGYECGYVNERPYDCVIVCVGYQRREVASPWDITRDYEAGGRVVARTATTGEDDVLAIGPAANIDLTERERDGIGQVPENSTALFRYAGRTATLADGLDAPLKPEQVPVQPKSRRERQRPTDGKLRVGQSIAAGDAPVGAVLAARSGVAIDKDVVKVGDSDYRGKNTGRTYAVADSDLATIRKLPDATDEGIISRAGDAMVGDVWINRPEGEGGILWSAFKEGERLTVTKVEQRKGRNPRIIVTNGDKTEQYDTESSVGRTRVRLFTSRIDDTPDKSDGPIGLDDRRGVPLSVGDRVRVTDSQRFGTVEGVVSGNADGRVEIDLDNGEVGYTSSTGRVENLTMPF